MLNKVTEDEAVKNALDEMVKNSGVELIGTVLEDENIKAFDLIGKPIVELHEDSKAVVAVKEVFEKVCEG